MSKVTAYYHIVFSTKSRQMTIPMAYKDDVYRFIWGQVRALKCDLLRIGGISNHIHMLVDLHPTVALSYLMQCVKGRTSSWMRSDRRFVKFRGWAADYYACTISPEQKYAVIEYIKSQETHHLGVGFDDELMSMYRYAAVPYDERDMT
ncbi:MAG: IS200/IS605 family transposase [Pseudoflavonifractor sp.]|nr:IS200/IS605 family transposase [Pseudoflavonifractor sp.]